MNAYCPKCDEGMNECRCPREPPPMSEFIPAEHESPPNEWTCHRSCGREGVVLMQHVDEGWIAAFCAVHNPMPAEPESRACEHGKLPGHCPTCGDLRELAKRASPGPYEVELGDEGHEIYSPSERLPYDYNDALFMAACTPERITDLLDDLARARLIAEQLTEDSLASLPWIELEEVSDA